MLKKMFAATTALIMIFSSFAVSYAEEAAEKQYIVRLKTSDVQLMNADGSRHFFDIADESTLDELLREDLVEWYEEDYSVELFDESEQNTEKLPEEPVPTEEHIKKYDESKWDLEMIRADFTYDINCEGQEIKIGVIDSGIADHADLKGNILEGHNYISGTYDTKDTYGHGTFVSGIIASQDDGEGIIGVVPKVRLVPLKCFDGKTTNVSVICKAIYGAVDDFGCDEFCVIMYRQLNRIDELNNKFKHALEQLRKGVGSFFGVSVGYAYYDEKKADIQDVIAQADEMMYQNKHENI